MSRTYWLEYEKGKGYSVYEEYVDGINEDAFQVIDKESYDDLAEINRDNRKHAQELGLCVDILTRKNNELTARLESSNDLNNVIHETMKNMEQELDYYKEMELRYNQLLEDTSAKQLVELQNDLKLCEQAVADAIEIQIDLATENKRLTAALNRIGILGMGGAGLYIRFYRKS